MKTRKSHAIKVTGVSEELLNLLDSKVAQEHAAGRAEYIRELIRKDVLGESKKRKFYETASPEEWAKAFQAWAESHQGWPSLSDEAISRKSIYGKRG